MHERSQCRTLAFLFVQEVNFTFLGSRDKILLDNYCCTLSKCGKRFPSVWPWFGHFVFARIGNGEI